MAEEKKYAQVSNESIQTWAETLGITELSSDVSRTLGADVTYRLHQVLNVCLILIFVILLPIIVKILIYFHYQ